jgi:hypothetical protein
VVIRLVAVLVHLTPSSTTVHCFGLAVFHSRGSLLAAALRHALLEHTRAWLR